MQCHKGESGEAAVPCWHAVRHRMMTRRELLDSAAALHTATKHAAAPTTAAPTIAPMPMATAATTVPATSSPRPPQQPLGATLSSACRRAAGGPACACRGSSMASPEPVHGALDSSETGDKKPDSGRSLHNHSASASINSHAAKGRSCALVPAAASDSPLLAAAHTYQCLRLPVPAGGAPRRCVRLHKSSRSWIGGRQWLHNRPGCFPLSTPPYMPDSCCR